MLYDPSRNEVDAVGRSLLKAAELVEHGWCQGSYARFTDDRADQHCTVGALAVARVPLEGWARMRKAIGQPDMVNWNDAEERTKGEVVAALCAAAVIRVDASELLDAGLHAEMNRALAGTIDNPSYVGPQWLRAWEHT